jgi:hypothetical protein
LSSLPEGGDRSGDTREEAGFVESRVAIILAGGYLESFCLEFSEVHGEAFVQGSVFFGGGGFCESGVGFGKFTDRL